MARKQAKQELYLVFGGELKDTQGMEFADLDKIDTVGIFPSYRRALDAWRGVSQKSVDNAFVRYVVVHLHELLHPAAKSPRRGSTRKTKAG